MCPLCLNKESELFDQDKVRSFEQCPFCQLVFVKREELISEDLEKKRYQSHENSENDEGYRKYLSQIATSIKNFLRPSAIGLDFGCGKTKMLGELLSPFNVASFDLYFHPDDHLLSEKYDFIILSEVIEHLRDPRETMLVLNNCLKSEGQLFIKTKVLPNSREEFSKWFYKRDITHIQFFNERSFHELAMLYNFKGPQKIGEDLYLFKR